MSEPWTRERIVAEIRTRYSDHEPLRRDSPEDRRLASLAQREFGNWETAMRAAGLAPAHLNWTRERLLELLRREYPTRGHRVWTGRVNSAAARLFGGRRRALRAAGFDVVLPTRTPRRWTRESVIACIRARHADGTLDRTHVEDPSLYSTARRHFGSWSRARVAAIGEPEEPPYPTPESVVETLRERFRHGRPRAQDDRILLSGCRRHFGGWQRALRAAGLDCPRPPRAWTRELVVEHLQRWARIGLSRMWDEDKRLYYAAVERFGSWDEALRAAGLESPPPRRRWTRESVIRALRAWSRIPGASVYRNDQGLVQAATRLFGGMPQAWEAAGIEPPFKKWTPQLVIEALQDRYVRGQSVARPRDLGASLALAVNRHFGCLERGLRAAGIDVSRLEGSQWNVA